MIIVAGTATLHEERIDEALDRLPDLHAATRAEAGCISYAFYRDVERPQVLHAFEEWESRAYLDAHLATAHVAEFLAFFSEALAGPLDFKVYEVAGVAPF
ncbi:MAG: antibiotic biosynthesis monooxygenase [Actinobacteria bacterium]|nr:antibiotic biosynthesis monooxygenase [Actinomycetota bacterium]